MVHIRGFKQKMWSNCNATLIVGRRRQGKSTILAMIAQEAIKAGYKVYSNYPIDGAIKIPKKTFQDRVIDLLERILKKLDGFDCLCDPDIDDEP